MANANNPHGLQPLSTNLAGGALALQELSKAVGDAVAIFRFDPVARIAGGAISGPGAGVTAITPGTTQLSGVALDYGAASTATTHKIVISPDALYEAQAAGTLAAADMGKNANLLLTTAGSATTKLSGAQIDDTTKATTSTLDVHLLALFANVDNAFGANARIEIVINKHRMYGGTAGV